MSDQESLMAKLGAPSNVELTNDEIAQAYWQLLVEKHNELESAHSRLALATSEIYVANDTREDNQKAAERSVGWCSDSVIILGQVVERARSARLVTVGAPK